MSMYSDRFYVSRIYYKLIVHLFQSGFSRSADLINPYHFWIKDCKYYSWGVSHKRETAKLKICCGVVNSVWLKLLLVANNTYYFFINIKFPV